MREFHTFKYRNHNLMEFGGIIAQRPTHVIAERDVDFVSIPFHSGDEYVDNGRYKNKSFPIKIRAVPSYCNLTFSQFTRAISDWLKADGYHEYRDTYNPGYYRIAAVSEIQDIIAVKRDVYETTVIFNFKPFLYRNAGKFPITKRTLTTDLYFELYNPENWEAAPVIKIIGTGSFLISINGTKIAAFIDDLLTIDKPNENFLDKNGDPCNDKISGLRIPYLAIGENTIHITRTDTSTDSFAVEVIPNWRRL